MMLNFTVEDEWIIKQIYKRGYINCKIQKLQGTKKKRKRIQKLRDIDNTT